MANTTRIVAIGGALAIVLSIVLLGATGTLSSAQKNSLTANIAQEPSGEYQEVTLRFINYEYQLTPSTLVKGVPVRMIVDLDTVYGCMRDIVIPSANVRKYVNNADNTIIFTPQEAGTFAIRCSMNMGRGTFQVIEPDGTKSDFKEAELTNTIDFPQQGSGSCGMNAIDSKQNADSCAQKSAAGSGCGCGAR